MDEGAYMASIETIAPGQAAAFHPTMATSGHKLTGLLGHRPRAQLRDDLQRMKTELESGGAAGQGKPDMASLAPGV